MFDKRELARIARGRLGAPLRFGYSAASWLEIAAFSAAARLRPAPSPTVPGLTTIAKTFERPKVVRRMLTSLRKIFDGPIIVADDSESPQTFPDEGVQEIHLPFDSGVARGRNAALAEVDTEFVLSVDDDFVFTRDVDLNRVVNYLRRNPEVDIVGGSVINLPLVQIVDYSTAPLFAYRGEPVLPLDTIVDGLRVVFKVPQFFIARTERLRVVGWDDALKRVDHTDFFTRAHGVLLTVQDKNFYCLHAQPKFDAHYQAFRGDTDSDNRYLNRKWSNG